MKRLAKLCFSYEFRAAVKAYDLSIEANFYSEMFGVEIEFGEGIFMRHRAGFIRAESAI